MNCSITSRFKNAFVAAILTCAVSTSGQTLELPTGEDAKIGDIFYPSLHVILSGGDSDGEPEDLAVGAHDPNDEFNVQGIEAGLSLRHGDHLQGYANWLFSYGDDDWSDENEEAFLALKNLPENWEIRGGRLLNRFGLLNAVHQHSWNAVDLPLASGRFMGEEHLATEGGDLTWYLPFRHKTALTLSYGDAREHDHDHGHGEDDEEHHEEDEHGG